MISMEDRKATFLPPLLLTLTFLFASLGIWATIISLAVLPLTVRFTARQFGVRDASHFYFSFTLCSMLFNYGIFEAVTHRHFAAITFLEYEISLALGGVTLALIFLTRQRNLEKETPSVISSYDFCKKCRRSVTRRCHHCVWLNTCISRQNKGAFLATLVFAAAWLFFNFQLNLTSLCYPVYLFKGFGWNDGTVVGGGRWFLVPTQCPDVYSSGGFWLTMSFVISWYSFAVAVLLILVLLHQLRLVFLGKTYLEYKFGERERKGNGKGVVGHS